MEKESIKVSVIIPVYNMEKYLRHSLESVMNQDLADMEIICINDGSTDSSLAILRQYQKQSDKFVIIDQSNQGVAYSRNLGICNAAGKYVAFLDPDDFLPDNDIMSALYQAAEKNDVLIAGGEFSDIDRRGNINIQYMGTLQGYTFEKEGIVYYADYQFDYGYHRFIYNREFLIRHHLVFPQLARFQDPPFMVQAFTMAEKFYAIKKVTYCYRINYHLVDWNKRKVADLLEGLHMNIRWAAQYQFADLMNLTIERMADEYREVIMFHFVRDIDIRDNVYKIVKDELVEENRKIKDFSDAIPDYMIQQFEHILYSKTYKVGSVITYLPKKLKKIFGEKL
ncbi:MAG: glycosyltransferase [Lachnospiraceae bacterium]|nr:glycosyltransferase [Lachnospiraceae bacterium]